MSASSIFQFHRFTPFRITMIMLTLVGCMSSTQIVHGAQIAWQRDLNKAASAARRLQEPLLIVVSARWCGFCQQMQQQTFPDAAVSRRINSQFVPVWIDVDEQPAVTEQLQAKGLPTILVVSPSGQVLDRITGFQSAAQLDARLASFQPKHQSAHFRPTFLRLPPPKSVGNA